MPMAPKPLGRGEGGSGRVRGPGGITVALAEQLS